MYNKNEASIVIVYLFSVHFSFDFTLIKYVKDACEINVYYKGSVYHSLHLLHN